MLTTLGILSSAGSDSGFATWNTSTGGSNVVLNGLQFTGTTGLTTGTRIATIGKSSGKWYWEIYINFTETPTTASPGRNIGIATIANNNTATLGTSADSVGLKQNAGTSSLPYTFVRSYALPQGVGTTSDRYVSTDVISFTLDLQNMEFKAYKNGTQLGSTLTGLPAGTWYPACGTDGRAGSGTANFGQNTWDTRTQTLRDSLTGFNLGIF